MLESQCGDGSDSGHTIGGNGGVLTATNDGGAITSSSTSNEGLYSGVILIYGDLPIGIIVQSISGVGAMRARA